ncbi:MAG: efflux RND transporter periplasmic adaptor subunit [Candidatus Paceibacterota bacterium]|jgi:HlyD family secretion protein
MGKKIFSYITGHKVIVGVVAVILLIGGYYLFFSGGTQQTRYAIAAVTKGTLVSSVSGTGQVSASNQVDLKAKVSGDVVVVNVQDGQAVKAGTLIAQLDAQDAQRAVRDAQLNLESAQLALAKLKKPADDLSLLQAQNALADAQASKPKAQDDLAQAYSDAFSTVSTVVSNVPGVISSAFPRTDPNQWQNLGGITYDSVLAQSTALTVSYQSASRTSDGATLDALLSQAYSLVSSVDAVVKNLGQASYITQVDGYLSDLSTAQQTIQTRKQAVADADQSIAEKTASLKQLQAGADALDIQSQELAIQQRQNALADAKEKLADYYITAPFDGVVTNVSVHAGDSIASIQSYGAIATLLTTQRIAEIPLNEVDAAKVKIGQKATLTFDAIDGLSVVGQITGMDAIGTVSQGVVTYTAKIAFAGQNAQIKPGMSVTANVITAVQNDALLVPNAAIKTQNGNSYVEVIDKNELTSSPTNASLYTAGVVPTRQAVTTGSSNDTETQIMAGLMEGQTVITQTVSSASTAASSGSSGAAGAGLRLLGR